MKPLWPSCRAATENAHEDALIHMSAISGMPGSHNGKNKLCTPTATDKQAGFWSPLSHKLQTKARHTQHDHNLPRAVDNSFSVSGHFPRAGQPAVTFNSVHLLSLRQRFKLLTTYCVLFTHQSSSHLAPHPLKPHHLSYCGSLNEHRIHTRLGASAAHLSLFETLDILNGCSTTDSSSLAV